VPASISARISPWLLVQNRRYNFGRQASGGLKATHASKSFVRRLNQQLIRCVITVMKPFAKILACCAVLPLVTGMPVCALVCSGIASPVAAQTEACSSSRHACCGHAQTHKTSPRPTAPGGPSCPKVCCRPVSATAGQEKVQTPEQALLPSFALLGEAVEIVSPVMVDPTAMAAGPPLNILQCRWRC